MARKSLSVEFDVDYGVNHRTGWTIVYDRRTLVQLEPWFLVAIAKAIPKWVRVKIWNYQNP